SPPLRAAALAFRDGFLAERFSDANGGKTAVRVYDAAALGAVQAYERAQLEGADFIVGPLLKTAVEEIVPKAGLVPTLALNFVQDQTESAGEPFPEGFYQFALWPEDEAREVAEQAAAAGAKTAVVLYPSTADPSTDRGNRVMRSFKTEFEALGGRVLGTMSYAPGVQDFSTPIEVLLNLDRSDRRFQRLQANLGLPMEFEPRRRRDVDMIFIGADRTNGLLLAPALRFHFAGDIPTYATSVIYEPGAAGSDNDLDGIYFPDAPWLVTPTAESTKLRSTLQSYWPARAVSDVQFYAMGADAYRLVDALYSKTEKWPLAGASGELVLDQIGRIHRDMPLAQFQNGQPVAVKTEAPSQQLAGTQ
ncbi:MAG TPA: penicillin-binding protein activator, partial [Gammaproteobacteria bacterium]|nr:penicillin-binding protein activator [Gammaproteobacteria bacterium]